MRLLTLVLVAITVSACSDRVPAPTTPTPTPRPGYPPAPVSELPEGVLFVQQPSSGPPLLFGIGADGEAQAYVRGSMFAGSPDGARAAFVAMEKGPNGAWLATGVGVLTGAGYKAIVQGGWEPTTMPVFDWSLDGKSFAYTQPDEVAKDRLQVWVVDADTGATRQLTTEPDFYSLLGWAATAEVLVSTSQGLMLVGKKPHPIELPEPGSIVDVEISPDGRSVAVKLGEYEQDPQTQLTYINSTGIWLLEISKGAWRELLDLADEPPGAQTTGGQEMQWSPDGRRITLHRTRIDDNGVVADVLSVLDIDSGKETPVHEKGWGWERWSPDGRYLAFTHWKVGFVTSDADRRFSIWDTSGRTRDVDAPVRALAWAGNGRLVLDIPTRLSLLDPETMEVKEVVAEDGERISGLIEAAVWSPSGRYVAVPTPSDQYHRSSLYVVDTEEGTAELFLDEAGFSAVAWFGE